MARGTLKSDTLPEKTYFNGKEYLTGPQMQEKFGWTTTVEQQKQFYDLQSNYLGTRKGDGVWARFFNEPELRIATAEKYGPFLKKLTEVYGHSELYSWMKKLLEDGSGPFDGWQSHIDKGVKLVDKYRAQWPDIVRQRWEVETRSTEEWNEKHRFRSNFKKRTPKPLEYFQKKNPLPA